MARVGSETETRESALTARAAIERPTTAGVGARASPRSKGDEQPGPECDRWHDATGSVPSSGRGDTRRPESQPQTPRAGFVLSRVPRATAAKRPTSPAPTRQGRPAGPQDSDPVPEEVPVGVVGNLVGQDERRRFFAQRRGSSRRIGIARQNEPRRLPVEPPPSPESLSSTEGRRGGVRTAAVSQASPIACACRMSAAGRRRRVARPENRQRDRET